MPHQPFDRRGYVLEAAILVAVLLAVLVGASATRIVTAQRTGNVDYRGSRTNQAAEAGADFLMSQLNAAMSDGLITDAELAALQPPVLGGFTFPTVQTTRDPVVVTRTILNGPHAGLFALNQRININVEARDSLQNRSQVLLAVNAQSIPLFQFGVFYNEDLEIHNGPTLDFEGRVHTNANLYLSSGSASRFYDVVSSADSVFFRRKRDATRSPNTVFINNNGGVQVPLTFDSRDLAGPAFVAASNRDFNGRLMSAASGVGDLALPLPPGLPPIELIRPRNMADVPATQAVKFAWKADMHVVVDMANFGLGCNGGITITRSPGRTVPSAATCATFFSTNDDAFADWREQIGVDALELNVGNLLSWANLAPANRVEILYITFVNAQSTAGYPGAYAAATSGRDYPAVRVTNASRLNTTGGFTLATDRPLYVWGHYNNDPTWRPSALIADAVTFLSPGWSDANRPWTSNGLPTGTFPTVIPARPASGTTPAASENTEIFAAVAAGHSWTPCDAARSGCAGPPYGGGLENFPRFIENWQPSSRRLTYRGSLVSLFRSQYAALGLWGGEYYGAPVRDWRFDMRFRDPNQLPPGTPVVGSVAQVSYRPLY